MLKAHRYGLAAPLLVVVLALALMACATAEPVVKEVPVEKIVTQQVIQTVEVRWTPSVGQYWSNVK